MYNYFLTITELLVLKKKADRDSGHYFEGHGLTWSVVLLRRREL